MLCRWTTITTLLLLTTHVLCQQSLLPPTFRACEPTTIHFNMTNGTAVDSSTSLKLSTPIGADSSQLFSVFLSDISKDVLTFIPPFSTGSTIDAIAVENGVSLRTNITVEDGGNSSCVISFSSSVNGSSSSPSSSLPSTKPLAFPGSAFEVEECTTLFLQWTGGKPPYSLSVLNATQSTSKVGVQFSALQDTFASVTFPLQAQGTAYTLLLEDSTGQNFTASLKIVSGGLTSSCLIEPHSTSSAFSSRSGTKKIAGVVAALLLMLAVFL